MRKSTKQKLEIERESNRILQSQIKVIKDLKNKELELKKEELETKNRADISLKEYEQLKEENKALKTQIASQEEALRKVFKPFKEKGVSEQILWKLMHGEFDNKVVVNYDVVSCMYEMVVIYRTEGERIRG